MPIFDAGSEPGTWHPSPLAAGPFAGLQGGAIAGLLIGEVEALAPSRGWGTAVSASIWFLRPVPAAPLRSAVAAIREGGRVSVVDNMLWSAGTVEPCAMARVTLAVTKPIEVEGFAHPEETSINPLDYPVSALAAPHGGPWFMDAMEARAAGQVSWFKLKHDVIAGAGPLAQVLGPADWAHGIHRPISGVVADPNSNLNVHLMRPPRGDWIGVESLTHWQPELGGGIGGGLLRDVFGVIGSVSMTVALTPFPKTSR
jgi:hypothetical protein